MKNNLSDLPSAAQEVPPDLLPQFRRMTFDNELAMMTALTWHFYEGNGEIIDAGAFSGASAYALAAGLANNPAAQTGRVHSYDTFMANGYAAKILAADGITSGDSFLPVFERNVKEYRSLINVYPGDITRMRWIGRPIEVFVCDVAKTPRINSFLLREYYPFFVPGDTVIVLQDFMFNECPWHHYNVGSLRDYVEVICVAPPSAVLRLVRPIPAQLLEEMAEDRYTWGEKLHLLDEAEEMFAGDGRKMVQVTKCHHQLNAGNPKAARLVYENSLSSGFEVKRFDRYVEQISNRLSRVENSGTSAERAKG